MRAIKQFLRRWPALWFGLRGVYQRLRGREEPEFALLPQLVDRERSAVDVGANVGAFTYRLAQLCPHTTAIEANPGLIGALRRISPSRVTVVHAAASDLAGDINLRLPAHDAGLAGLGTVAASNALGGAATVSVMVPSVRLADLGLIDVGFIKIDVEGHELAVLKGAEPLLRTCRPTLLIEAEERHRTGAVASIRALLEPLGYRGYMLAPGGGLVGIETFDPARQRALAEAAGPRLDRGHAPIGYINNFIFIAETR